MENTPSRHPGPPPLFAWPRPGPGAPQVTWPDFLKLVAEACETTYQGPPGRFISGTTREMRHMMRRELM
jgi:hypothetical protein